MIKTLPGFVCKLCNSTLPIQKYNPVIWDLIILICFSLPEPTGKKRTINSPLTV